MRAVIFLEVEDVRTWHARGLERFGGQAGERDPPGAASLAELSPSPRDQRLFAATDATARALVGEVDALHDEVVATTTDAVEGPPTWA